MFWNSLFAGMLVFLSWKIWVALLLYLLANMLVLATGGGLFAAAEKGSGAAGTAGCLFTMFVPPLMQGVLMSIFVLFMYPVMLGVGDASSLQEALPMLWPMIRVGVLAIIFVVAVCFIPVLGAFIAESPGIQTFIVGAIIFRLFLGAGLHELGVTTTQSPYPSLWACLGYVVISGVLVKILMLIGAAVAHSLEKSQHDAISALVTVTVAPVLGLFGGFLPFFMYVQYVKLGITAYRSS